MTIRRRDFITLIGGAAAAGPLAAMAQPLRRIGVLMNGAASNRPGQANVAAFAEQLRKLGWVEGRAIHSEIRWNDGSAATARAMAAELVTLGVDVILSSTTINLTALQRLSPTMPVVFIQVSDPETQGFVLNMAHPGSNITGFQYFEFTIGGKLVDLLKQLVPMLAHVGVMFDPETSPQIKFFMGSIEAAAQMFAITVETIAVEPAGIDSAIADFSRKPNSGLIFPPGTLVTANRDLVISAASRNRVPAIYANGAGDYSHAGALIEYGPNVVDQYRQAAVYVDRILRGAKTGDLPVQTPTKFTLYINLKAARNLGIEIPMSLLLAADELVE
jgi:putative ABC transport system substrate-binding protein